MNQLVYSPLNTLYGLRRLGRVLQDEFPQGARASESASWVPQVDIRELDTSFTVQVDIPGVDPKSIDITVADNVLTIKGSRSQETADEAKGFKRLERFSGTFIRQFTLPETADGSLITARGNHGVLEISIPKTEKSKPLTIAVEA